ncbi:Ig-like domain-containing protein [Shewanella insulae]|uniref:Ig-like domain-containing protein n=1 Tax=Shewanella insulae TaxID=2681496 RepID=UPI001EFC35A2|nr:Ig-like domain-containing protein [Shewanella insulae]MCG9738424.1 Ig-like domain-containing protein [Shewanella insulae]
MFKGLMRIGCMLILASQLSACGGGSGSSETDKTAVKLSQTLSFSQSGTIEKTYGDEAFSNSLQDLLGTGAISYTSSNPQVVSVSSDGLVTIISAGSSTITVQVAEDAKYLAASAAYQVNVAKAERAIAFDNTGTVALFIDQTYLNPVNVDVANITFSSQDPAVASVNADGQVTAHTPGETQIFAEIAETANYLKASSSFFASVAPTSLTLKLLIGADDTEVFTDVETPLQLARTTQADCDFNNLSNCDNGLVDKLSTQPLIDSSLTTTSDAYFNLFHGQHTGQASYVANNNLARRTLAKAVSFDGYLWLIGGYEQAGNDASIWRSKDGNIWQKVVDEAPFGERPPVAVITFADHIWLVGTRRDNKLNDVWRSADGINWTLVNADIGFSERNGYSMATFNDKMWIYGGYDFQAEDYVKEIYSSTDGITWKLESSDSTATQRVSAAFIEFKDKLWQFSGRNDTQKTADIWSSDDGIHWTKISNDAGFSGRERHEVRQVGNQLILLGGYIDRLDPNRSAFPNDVWISTDGASWTLATADANFGLKSYMVDRVRKYFTTAVHNDALVVIGGKSENGIILNDNWQTTDGKHWQPLNNQLPAMTDIQAVSHQGEIQLLSGTNEDFEKVSIRWHSTDGFSWTLDDSTTLPFPTDSKLLTFAGKIWALHASGSYSSLDGKSWNQEALTGPNVGTQDGQYSVYSFDNKLWAINTQSGVVYRSEDGINWTDVGNNNFPTRAVTQISSFGGKLWVIAGHETPSRTTQLSDIWSTTDGITWTKEAVTTGLGARHIHQLVEFDGKLWAFGGYGANQTLTDLWYSQDGSSWTKAMDNVPFDAKRGYRAMVHGDQLIILGGLMPHPQDPDLQINANQVWMTTNGSEWRRALQQHLSF